MSCSLIQASVASPEQACWWLGGCQNDQQSAGRQDADLPMAVSSGLKVAGSQAFGPKEDWGRQAIHCHGWRIRYLSGKLEGSRLAGKADGWIMRACRDSRLTHFQHG